VSVAFRNAVSCSFEWGEGEVELIFLLWIGRCRSSVGVGSRCSSIWRVEKCDGSRGVYIVVVVMGQAFSGSGVSGSR
jgi:hypothetical protein